MDAEYIELFKMPVDFRIIEKRTTLLERFVSENNLDEPKSIECRPLKGCQPKRCFINVEEQIQGQGGKMETGWLFFEFKDRLMGSEAHAIWISLHGKKLDITPHRLQPRRILFSRDENVALKRGYTAPFKLILTTDPRIRAIAEFDWALDKLEAEKFNGFGKTITISEEEAIRMAKEANLPFDVACHIYKLRSARVV